MIQKKKNAIMLADTRISLVGTMLLQLQDTNPGLFDEAIIYYTEEISTLDQKLMNSIIPCRFVKYTPPLPEKLFEKPRFKLFSILMFTRYEMFGYLEEFETITWLDTDILIQGDISGILKAAEKTGAAFIREDPINKTAEKTDRMRSCFVSSLPNHYTNEYLYCSGTIVLTDKLLGIKGCTRWCYEKTVEWADNLSLPDQGVINAAIQEFNVKVTPVPGKVYCCYPYMGRDSSDATIIHSWGMNKFWNDWYVYLQYPGWRRYYEKWLSMGGHGLPYEIGPRISVVIPSYKPNLDMFRQCLDSLITQKRSVWERFSDFEIIIVAEPFEEEGLKRLAASYDDPRIRLEFNEKRLGIAASLNRGLRLAQGRYIARMDDDDLASENRLFRQAEYLDSHKDISLCTTDFEYFGDMNESRVSFEGELSRAWSIFTCPFDHPTIMFRREFFISNNLFYDEQRGYVEDWELWLRAFEAGMKVGCIHEVLFYHRWINNGSAGQTNKTVEMMRELIQHNFKKLDVEISTEDLPLIGPWNGRLMNDGDVEKLNNYFSKALEANREKKFYDQLSLSKVFSLRLAEAKTGTLPGIAERIERKAPQQVLGKGEDEGAATTVLPAEFSEKPIKPNFFKRILKNLFKPLYKPFRLRYEDRILSIQQEGWAIEGHVLNCVAKLDQIASAQAKQFDLLSAQGEQISAQARQIDLLSARIDIMEQALNESGGKLITVGDKLYDLSREFHYEQSFHFSERFTEKKIVLVGTPEHSNIGDAAIAMGEMEFIRRFFSDYRLVELSTYDFNDWYARLSSVVNSGDILFLQGGGNLGNRYISEENIRRRVISDFPKNKIVILPQTIHFDDNELGHRELALSEKIYNNHKNLILFTRGQRSFDFAKTHFSGAKCINAPDMALMLDVDFSLDRKGLLLCIRDLGDESGMMEEQYNFVAETVRRLDPNFTKTNNLYQGEARVNIYRDMRRSVVTDELKRFSERSAVITDRLHGFIFAVITHTPCVVMSSYNRKIEEFYSFFADSNAVFFIDRDLSLLEDAIQKAMTVEKPVYPLIERQPFDDIFRAIAQENV
ncbi:MAG: polysaccharide pyruvyl transferase family protein [Bacteroidales bacterium]